MQDSPAFPIPQSPKELSRHIIDIDTITMLLKGGDLILSGKHENFEVRLAENDIVTDLDDAVRLLEASWDAM